MTEVQIEIPGTVITDLCLRFVIRRLALFGSVLTPLDLSCEPAYFTAMRRDEQQPVPSGASLAA